MPHTAAFYDWKARVNALRVALKPHHRAALAEYSFGRALARCGGRTSVAASVAASLAVKAGTLPQRLRELYPPASAQIGAARSEFDYTLCCAPLVRWAAAGHPDKRLVLALDPTGRTDRFRVPCAAVLYRGCGLPVAGAVQAADEKGSWNAIWFDLLGKLEAARGDGRTVPVLTDRGPESPALFRARVRLGWHPLVRVKGRATFRPAGGHSGYRADHFAAQVGGVWSGEGVAYPAGDRRGCTRLASWGCRARRAVAAPDGPAGDGRQRRLVCVADVDRAGVPGAEAGVLAVAAGADVRAGSCGAAVGGDRGGDDVRGGGRRRSGTGRRATGRRAVEPVEARSVADLGGVAEPRIDARREDRTSRLAETR